MCTKEDLKLIGFFPSPYVYRVIWALKLKGLEFEYIEEDIFNKTELLFKYNPIHLKVPVLIHGGKPVAESMVILEYIEEMWPGVYPLLPTDPYERAQARFLIKYGEDTNRASCTFFIKAGEEQAKAVEESREIFRILESQLGDKKFFGGNEAGMADLEFGWIPCFLDVLEEAAGVRVMSESSDDFPRLKVWINEFRNLKAVKENVPDREKITAYFKHIREKFLTTNFFH